ncbi:serine protease Do [Paucibacter oligotrophus]|uniref:Probable periplasmic serine endoprotease DegP-like n=1 Tax=Roseateles oligotrophus TaxID=1769250 RepID=A0A840L366_9BURK|nr:DegQ family serine endoprotease [Roseateles oligotrophus]MBB4842386.1 serine protease Do [Roseateles oligotrophus]
MPSTSVTSRPSSATLAVTRKPGFTRILISAAVLSLSLSLAPTVAAAQARDLPDFTELVEKVGPAVVNIRTSERAKTAANGAPEMDEQMQEFLRRFGIPLPGQRRGAPRGGEDEAPQRRGIGSGFVLSADGYVMTNAHVVNGADEVFVTLTDKREFKAKIIGTDVRTDVAVLKIEAGGLPAVKIGDVGRLKVGEWVMAIGSPFGFDNSVTAGIVSAKARDTGDFLPFIQTDVAINPGNSGGPLLNMRGEVVGINSQIYSQSGGFMGISFAIPIDEAIRVSDQLRSSGKVVRGFIGVAPDDLSKEVAESIGLGKPTGAVIRSVTAGGAADKAGIEGGDVITKFDGKTIEKASDLRRVVAGLKPGAKSSVQVYRRGAYKDLSITIAEMPSDKQARAGSEPDAKAAPSSTAALGLQISEIPEAQKKELKLRAGVRVDGASGVAARAGLREGDLILSVDNVEVSSVKQFQAQLAKLEKAKVINLVVRRDDVVSFVLLRPVH